MNLSHKFNAEEKKKILEYTLSDFSYANYKKQARSHL